MKSLLEHPELVNPEDDWTGMSSAQQRRRLQNRLNQRIYRRRRGLNGRNQDQVSSAVSDVQPLAPDRRIETAPNTESGGKQSATLCKLSAADGQILIAEFNERMHRSYEAHSPRLDMLLTLVHFNVFRALVSNTSSMGFTMEWLNEDAESPFNAPQPGSSIVSASCPSSLSPTDLQRTVAHHPWIDLFPFPRMRDNLLLAGDSYDEDQLCIDLVEFCHVPCEQMGLIVWGEPDDPRGWEVSESFLKRWGWVIKGCHELFAATNYRRAERGEEPLVFEL